MDLILAQTTEALRVLYSTHDASIRQSADAWLQDFQASDVAWEASLHLLRSSDAQAKFFGSTVLCTKLRGGGGGGLPPASSGQLRTSLLQQLGSLDPDGPRNIQQQCCRACALLLGDGGMASLLADPDFAALTAENMLQILAFVPESGTFVDSSTTGAAQRMLVAWLGHACTPNALLPPQLPPRASPKDRDREFRLAVLECTCQWATLPATDGLTLSNLVQSDCFGSLCVAMDLSGMPITSDPSPFLNEMRLAFELFRLALEEEPTEQEFLPLALPPSAPDQGSPPPAVRRPTPGNPQLVGSHLPAVRRTNRTALALMAAQLYLCPSAQLCRAFLCYL